MYQKERLDGIVDILKHHGYVTVKFLKDTLHYSTATINRDLNTLEKQKIVHRSWGGVELVKNRGVALPFRYHKMKSIKARLGKKAAELVHDGDTVFLDATTTTEYISHYLVNKKEITVITNNMAVVSYLSNFGVEALCLGGRVVESPSMLGGDDAVYMAKRYNADIMFFSTGGFTSDGLIQGDSVYDSIRYAMAENSKKVYFVADHEKLDKSFKKNIFTFADIDGVISDCIFPDETKEKYNKTEFLEVL